MPDYNLGRASGRIEIDYDGTGTSKAIHDLDKAAKSSDDLDKSLSKTEKTLHDTDKQLGSSGNAAQGYSARLKEVRESSENVDRFEKAYQRTLLDSKSQLSDIQKAHDKVTEAKKRHTKATTAERDAHKALAAQLSVGKNAMKALGDVIPALQRHLSSLGDVEQSVSEKTSGLAKGLGLAAKGLALLGPEGKAASVGAELAAKGVDKVGSSSKTAGGHIANFVKELASFELAFAKISGLTLGATSLGGLAGIGGAAALMGVVEMADAVKQLSGALGLLPAAIAGVGFSALTLKVAFHGVGDAIKDMMADDPKKFLEDIQNMGPVAARSMLQIAAFRDQFKLAGAAVQDSFFAKIAADIAPLIQTWLPAVTSGMAQISGIFGDFGHQFAGIMAQPATMTAFKGFIDSLAGGLRALQPAMGPLVHMFETLTTVGASFFPMIGQMLTSATSFFDKIVSKAAASGALQEWITTGIDAFAHLGNILYQVGSAFLNIMNVADRFGGGGLLGFLDDLTNSLAQWTESADGQKSLTNFFSTLRQATDAFLPVLKPLTEGLMSVVSAFVQLGIATAPAWVDFFKTFASVMAQMGPQIAATAPAIAEFLQHMATAMIRLGQTLGPELPKIFQTLADAFVQLLPQLPPLVKIFTQLIEQVGPQLPKMFEEVTTVIEKLIPLTPQIVDGFSLFVSAITLVIEAGGKLADVINLNVQFFGKIGDAIGGFLGAVADFVGKIPQELSGLGKGIENFFSDLPHKAEEWGKKLVEGLIHGMLDSAGLGGLDHAANSIVDQIARWFQKSPAEVGPFSGSGYTLLRGQKMVTDMAVGMVSARGAVAAAGRATAQAAAGGLASGGSRGGGGAPAAGGAGSVGNALLPDNIAGADQSPLDAYLNHQFPENRGLKGLAKNMGALLSVAQNGFNLAYQHIFQPMMQLAQAVPGANQQTWRKMTDAQQQQALRRKAGEQGPGWQDVLGGPTGAVPGTHTAVGASGVGALTPGATTQDKQLAIIAKGKSLGLSDQEIQGILGIAQEESGFSNTGFLGFGPEAKAQGINIDQNPQAALDLFFKNYMAGGLGSGGPTKSQVVGPGGEILDQQGFINFLWHRMQGAADPAYGRKLSAAIASQTLLYPGLLSKLGTPTWGSAPGALGTPSGAAPLFTSEGPEFYDRAFAHNREFAKPSTANYQSNLTPQQEQEFRKWVEGQKVPFDPNASKVDYDMRGYWLAMTEGKTPPWVTGGHFPDTFKTPYDTTFSAESQYATPNNPFKWQGDNLIDTRSGQLVFGTPTPPPPAGGDVGPYGSRTLPLPLGAAAGQPLPQPTGAPNLSGLQLPNVRGAHPQLAYALAAIQRLFPSATLNAGKDDHGFDQGWHPRGQAIDIGAPGDNPQTLAAISNWLLQFAPNIEELIHSGPGVLQNIKSGRLGPAIDMAGSVYNSGQAGYHGDHVHLAITDQMAQAFEAALLSGGVLPPGITATGLGASAAASGNGGLTLPSGKSLDQLINSSGQTLNVNEQQLQAYLQGNPALADQINAANATGASDQQVLGGLNGITSAITTLQQQDATGNAGTISALQATQQQIAGQGGFTQGQSGLQSALSIGGAIGSGAANAITGAFQVVSSGLDAAAGTQDIADRLVYGIRGTQDVGKVIDDFQKYITFAADIASEVGNVLTSIGSIISVIGQAGAAAPTGGFGDPGAAVAAVGQGFQFAGMIASVISGVLQGINTAIDYVQQVNQIVGGYVGRFLSNLTAGPFGGTPLMGNVRSLLNKNTGQLITYSEDNPLNKNTLNVPASLAALYGFGNANPHPTVNQQWILYAGPGEPVAQVLNHAAFMVASGATTGANGPQHF